MKRRALEPSLDNILRLFARRLKEFKGESLRSYRKAFSSFQIYCLSTYPPDKKFDAGVIENWITACILQNLSHKTISFYLEKISSLYSAVAGKLSGGKELIFKIIKNRFKEIRTNPNDIKGIMEVVSRLQYIYNKSRQEGKENPLILSIINYPLQNHEGKRESLGYLWGCLALKAGISGEIIRGIIGEVPRKLPILALFDEIEVDEAERLMVSRVISRILEGEEEKWFAMRLRRKVSFEDLLNRFSLLSSEIKMPELFYPLEEIARHTGRKVVWKGRPVIRDIVFFKKRRSEIYSLFTLLYDLAWCYKDPGTGNANYAMIPDKAMEDFKRCIGFLTPDYEVAPAGEIDFKPGDKVIILNGENMERYGEIIKKPSIDDDGNKIYRVTLLHSNGRWDIGVDARLLKKA